MTPNKLKKLQKYMEDPNLSLYDELNELNETLSGTFAGVNLETLEKIEGKPGKDGNHGKDGVNGTHGRDGRDGKDGKPGKDGKSPIPGVDFALPKNGRDGTELTSQQIRDRLRALKDKERLGTADIEGMFSLDDVVKYIKEKKPLDVMDLKNGQQLLYPNKKQIDQRYHGSGIWQLTAGSNITITDTDASNPNNGAKTISASSSGGTLTSINGDATPAQTLAVGTSGTDFAIADNGTGTHTFNLPTASATNRGALSSLDWSDFDSKQDGSASLTALAALAGTGFVAQTGASSFADRTLTGTTNQVSITNPSGIAGNPVFSLPQDIATSSLPTFSRVNLSSATAIQGTNATVTVIRALNAATVATIGAAAALVGGNGNTSGNGGTSGVTGGTGGSTGNGGTVSITGGAGGSTSGQGGEANVVGGAAQGGNSVGGQVIITGGNGDGTGTDGRVVIKGANPAVASSTVGTGIEIDTHLTTSVPRTVTFQDVAGTVYVTGGADVAVADGGTGQSSYTDGQLLIGNTATGGLSKATLTQGAGVTITNGNGTVTIAATGGSTSPAGSTTEVQYNNAGAFGASSSFIFDNAAKLLKVSAVADAVYHRLQGASDGDNYAAFELWNAAADRKWQFALGATNADFNFNHNDGSGWSEPFALTHENKLKLGVTGTSSTKYMLENDGDNILTLQRQGGNPIGSDDAYTLLQVKAPASSTDKEATLALTADFGGGNVEFLDLYNNKYASDMNYGLRVQKRGTGSYRPFVFDYYDGVTKTEVLRLTDTIITNTTPITGPRQERVVSMADATSFTMTSATADINTQANTQSAGVLTANAPSGSPTHGQQIQLEITSTNVQTFSWNAIFRGSTDISLPSATSGAGKTDIMLFQYSSTATAWRIMSKSLGYS